MRCPHCKKLFFNRFSKKVRNGQCPHCNNPIELEFSFLRGVKIFFLLLGVIVVISLLGSISSSFDNVVRSLGINYLTSPIVLGIVTMYCSARIKLPDDKK